MQNENAAHALRRASVAAGCLALSAALAVSVHPAAFATSSSLHDSKAQEYADSSAQKKAEAADIQQQIDALQTRINEATAVYDAALAEYEAASAAVEDADARMRDAEERTLRLRDQLGSRAITMYKTGETNIVDVLLGSSSFDSFIKSWDAVRRIADQDAQWIEESKQARLDAYEAREEGVRQRAIAQEKTEEAERARIEVVASQAEMQTTLAGVNEEIARLDALQEEEEMAAEEARRLEEEAARLAAQKFNVGSGAIAGAISAGGWTHPLPGARVTSEYGSRTDPITGAVSAYHSGIDLAMPLGTPVGAAKAGTVSYVGWYGTGGNAVIVNHGDGVRTVYMHLNSFNVSVGDVVQAGQCIAFVGNTGRSTGPHLHFNVEINKTPINPRAVLSF